MSAVAGPFFAAAGLLGVAGAAKVARPSSTVRALRAAALPGTATGEGLGAPVAGRLLGVVEVAVAVAALALGGRATAGLVAATYAGFALFTARLLRTAGAGADCGCFGAETSPASSIHIVVNLVIAAIAGLAVAWPTRPLAGVLGDQPLAGLPFLGVTVVSGWLLFAFLTVVPDLRAAAAEASGASPSAARP